MNLREMLIREEGWKHDAYPDPLTHSAPWTIGVGHTGPEVHEHLVWSDEQIGNALDADIAHASVECQRSFAPWFQHLDEPRQAVLIGMVFQMGIGRLLKFKNTLRAVSEAQWEKAADGMLNSLWGSQTPARAKRMAEQMRTGEWS